MLARLVPRAARTFACHRMKKFHLEIYARILRFIAQQTLGLHQTRLAILLRAAVILWINTPEGEPFSLIFLRRGAVGVKNVALVENSVHQTIEQFAVHAPFANNFSTAASQLVSPC